MNESSALTQSSVQGTFSRKGLKPELLLEFKRWFDTTLVRVSLFPYYSPEQWSRNEDDRISTIPPDVPAEDPERVRRAQPSRVRYPHLPDLDGANGVEMTRYSLRLNLYNKEIAAVNAIRKELIDIASEDILRPVEVFLSNKVVSIFILRITTA